MLTYTTRYTYFLMWRSSEVIGEFDYSFIIKGGEGKCTLAYLHLITSKYKIRCIHSTDIHNTINILEQHRFANTVESLFATITTPLSLYQSLILLEKRVLRRGRLQRTQHLAFQLKIVGERVRRSVEHCGSDHLRDAHRCDESGLAAGRNGTRAIRTFSGAAARSRCAFSVNGTPSMSLYVPSVWCCTVIAPLALAALPSGVLLRNGRLSGGRVGVGSR